MTSYVKDIVLDFSVPTNGTSDCSAAWAAITTFLSGLAGGDTVHLNVPNHTYVFDIGGSAITLLTGVLGGLTVTLDAPLGATFTDGGGSGFFHASAGIPDNNLNSSRIETALEGATAVVLKTVSQHTRYVVGRWIAVTHGDLQGFGSPPNPMKFKYHKITANPGTGTITVTPALTQTYLSTMPLFNAGGPTPAPDSLDCGGPATIYALPVGWDIDATFNNITTDQGGQQYFKGRKATFNGGTIVNAAGFTPTLNQEIIFNNVDMSACSCEVDKMVDVLRYTNCLVDKLTFQSMSCATNCYVTNSAVRVYNGTPENIEINGGSTDSLQIGATSFGITKSVTCNGCVIADLTANAVHVDGIIAAGYTMAGGVIRVPDSEGPPSWAVPGANCYFNGSKVNEDNGFVVLSVTQDATHTIVTTSATGGFPSVPGTLALYVHPCPVWTGTGNTGCPAALDLSQAGAQGRPLYSYSKRTYTGGTDPDYYSLVAASLHPSFPLWGHPLSIKFNVIRAYTGVQGTLTFEPTFNIDWLDTDPNTVVGWLPVVNLKTDGLRTVTPNGVTGSVVGDTIPTPRASYWAQQNARPRMTTNISAENSALWPIVEIEYVMEQGLLTASEEVSEAGPAEFLAFHSDHAPVKHYAKLNKVEELVRRVAPERIPEPTILPRDFFEDVPKKKRRFTIADGFSDA